jgi:hypothetical protein
MSNVQRTGIPLSICSCIQLAFIIHFVVYEKRLHGLKALWENKFVRISLFGNFFILLSTLDNIIASMVTDQIIVYNQTSRQVISMVGVISIWLVMGAHLTLALLRSETVFRSSDSYLKSIRIAVILFCVLAAGTTVFFFINLFTSISLLIEIQVADLMTQVAFSCIDFICTFAFVRFVRDLPKSTSNSLVENETYNLQTMLIAKRSSQICFLTALNSFIYGTLLIVITFANASIQVVTGFIVAEQIVLIIAMTMWMRLKIELDQLTDNQSKARLIMVETKYQTSNQRSH